MAWLTAVQYAGFTMTPFFGAMFSNFFLVEEREINIGSVSQACCLLSSPTLEDPH